jgi:PhoPQ-activated pathogenicity-related protein
VRCRPWQDEPWTHDVVLVGEPGPEATLYLTGGDPHPQDIAWARTLAARSRRPVAIVFQVPNQPRFGLTEDWLIARTFDEYLATGDPGWPLLLPMADGAAAAAEAAGEAWGCRSWVAAGASKRAWTAWLAAVRWPERFVGVASLAFDHLDMRAQVDRQRAAWGTPSPMYEPYSELGLLERAHGPEGDGLLALVDPGLHLDRLRAEVLLSTGANDPFWMLDAASVYWNRIPTRKRAAFRPNLGHALPSDPASLGSVGVFVDGCFGGEALPEPALEQVDGRFVCPWEGDAVAWLWSAGSDSPNFVGARWRPILLAGAAPLPPEVAEAPWRAVFVELCGADGRGPWSATSIPQVAGPSTGWR